MLFEPWRILSPSIPFRKDIHPIVGELYVINGVTFSHAKRITVNFYAKQDTALHVDIRFSEKAVVRNTRLDDAWGKEERNGRMPITTGRYFQLDILVDNESFKLGFNGRHFAEYCHRIPHGDISEFEIFGDADIFLLQRTNPPYDLMKEIESKSVVNIIQKEFSKSEKKFPIPDGIHSSGILRICGIPTDDTFSLDFFPNEKSDDLGLHVSCRIKENSVVLNSREKMKWQSEIRPPNFRFHEGEHFDLEITAQEKTILLLLNSTVMAVFPARRLLPDQLKFFQVNGLVKLLRVTLEKYDFQ